MRFIYATLSLKLSSVQHSFFSADLEHKFCNSPSFRSLYSTTDSINAF